VAGGAVESVKLEMQVEVVLEEKPALASQTHLGERRPDHVPRHQMLDLQNRLLGEPKPINDSDGHVRSDRLMPEKGAAPLVRRDHRGGFADVVEQRRPRERLPPAPVSVEEQSRVREDIALRVVRRIMREFDESVDLRQQKRQQAGFVKQADPASAVPGDQDLRELVANALGGDVGNARMLRFDRGARRPVDHESQHRGEPNGPQHSQPILAEALKRIADGADDSLFEVRASAHEIEDLLREWILEHPVDRKVATRGVGSRIREAHCLGMPAVGDADILTERRDLDRRVFEHDHDHAESRPDSHGARKQRLHVVGRGGRRHVVVGDRSSEQSIPDAASREERFVTRVTQSSHHPRGNRSVRHLPRAYRFGKTRAESGASGFQLLASRSRLEARRLMPGSAYVRSVASRTREPYFLSGSVLPCFCGHLRPLRPPRSVSSASSVFTRSAATRIGR